MAGRRPVTFAALGLVVGVVVTALVAVALWPEGSRRSEGGDRGREPAAEPVGAPTPAVPELAAVEVPRLDLSAANRRAPLAGLPDWSKAGYRGGQSLPTDDDLTADESCRITADELAGDFDVRPDDGVDDTAGLQEAIDAVRDDCSPSASYEELSLLSLPAGVLDVSRQIAVDADYLVIRGAGASPAAGTRLVFRPDENTRYDTLTDDGGDWDESGMEHDDGKGGWIWPGRALFRVQSREVHEDYRDAYESAPANRRDLFEGTVNVHWKAGAELRAKPGDDGFSARTGDTVVHLADGADMDHFAVGGYVNVRAANSTAFYEQQAALPTEHELQNLHMRQQIFTVAAVDPAERTFTIDKPLEFDLPVDSTSDGSDEIDGDTYASKAAPLVDPVVGVGFEGFHLTQVVDGSEPDEVAHDYANVAPAAEMHGIVFKWAADSWVRGIATYMTGSHPIVTEEAKNLQIEGNYFDGAWNKGAGGNGYLRGSRVWDSLYAGNVIRNLRHVTFQWSASGNVFIGNDVDADLNLHGGWERHNLFELNTVRVPFEHRPGNCSTHCGGEGGAERDESTWYPIWWGAGQKAVKWSGATGPRNVFFNNTMAKQLTEGGEFTPYYAEPRTIFRFGWDGSAYRHLAEGGRPIPDWAGREGTDYRDGGGVESSLTDERPSLFLVTVAP
jgi:hypothetical protein